MSVLVVFKIHQSIFIPLCHKKNSEELTGEMRRKADYLRRGCQGRLRRKCAQVVDHEDLDIETGRRHWKRTLQEIKP